MTYLGSNRLPASVTDTENHKIDFTYDSKSRITKIIDALDLNSFGNKYTLLEAEPVTGRTHQIRIHLKHIFHSIVSDRLYSGRKTLKQDEKIFPRMFLHACRLSFIHPVTTELITVTSPMPSDLEKALGNLEVEQTGLIR